MLKMLIKEIFFVDKADKLLYAVAPFLVIFGSVGAFCFLPWNKGAHILDFNVGIFLLTAISSIGVVGIFMAGWASNNKYSVVSAMRAAVQMISYEMSLCLCLITAVILTGTMQVSGIVESQSGPWGWLIVQGHVPAIIAFIVFLIAGNAEANRGPFDMAEAESELTAGHLLPLTDMIRSESGELTNCFVSPPDLRLVFSRVICMSFLRTSPIFLLRTVSV